MSHVTAHPDLFITDLEVLAEVAKELGMEMVEASTYRWYGRWLNDWHAAEAAYKLGIKPEEFGKCDSGFKLTIPGNKTAYEVGVHKHPEGTGYIVVYDQYASPGGTALLKKIGNNCEKLKQGYTLALAKKMSEKKGFRLGAQKKLEGGKIELKMWKGV